MARRHHAKIKVSEIRKLARFQVTEREAAAFFGVRISTFKELLRIDAAARQAWEEGIQGGKISIRRKQFMLADTNATMAIFLGKQYLGQSDVTVTELSGRDGAPINTIDLGRLSAEERKELRRIASRASTDGPDSDPSLP